MIYLQGKFNLTEYITLNIDENWTLEVIFNIIDNAIKYAYNTGTIIIDTLQHEIFAIKVIYNLNKVIISC